MKLNSDRIDNHIKRISQFNSTPEKGITRFSYTEEDRKARDYLLEQMEKINLNITVDPIGNIRARREGADPDALPILAGSHIDTVLHGGKYDGMVGVVTALEALTVLEKENIKLEAPVELIIFVEEEGANFGSPLAGSKTLIGDYKVNDLKKLINDNGVSMYEAAKKFGLNPDQMIDYLVKPGEVKAMLEVHVEQSLVLDEEDISVGVVSGINGMRWLEFEFTGQSNHAGATPMYYRKDPMVGASQLISFINEYINKNYDSAVGTVGKIKCEPNVPNVIPESVNFMLDLRDIESKNMEKIIGALKDKAGEIASKYSLKYSIERKGETEPIYLPDDIVDIIKESAEKRDIEYKVMTSGALHDSCVLGKVTDVGMIFVPSINGRSHVPEEETALRDITLGAEVLLHTIIKLATI